MNLYLYTFLFLLPYICHSKTIESSKLFSSIQRRFHTYNYQVVVPFYYKYPERIYNYRNELWGRGTYEEAVNICKSYDMELPDDKFWEESLTLNVFDEYSLSKKLPFWEKDGYAFSSYYQKESWSEVALLGILCISKK